MLGETPKKLSSAAVAATVAADASTNQEKDFVSMLKAASFQVSHEDASNVHPSQGSYHLENYEDGQRYLTVSLPGSLYGHNCPLKFMNWQISSAIFKAIKVLGHHEKGYTNYYVLRWAQVHCVDLNVPTRTHVIYNYKETFSWTSGELAEPVDPSDSLSPARHKVDVSRDLEATSARLAQSPLGMMAFGFRDTVFTSSL